MVRCPYVALRWTGGMSSLSWHDLNSYSLFADNKHQIPTTAPANKIKWVLKLDEQIFLHHCPAQKKSYTTALHNLPPSIFLFYPSFV